MNSDYKVLYRKYRPSSFDEVVGQKFTINMLKNAVLNNKLSHAYIFTGPRGTGKTSTAKIFAKTINCENPVEGVPCGKCNSCLNINNNADIIEIDAASNNGVDEIRELINNVKIAPSFSKYKVYIIDEVHMLSQSAFNALLLTLEEPPSHIIFILATTNIESVPITILSRCQRYDFKKISDIDIVDHLQMVADKENIDISEDAIKEIAYLSDGGLRDALSILNQLYTSSNSITLETVLDNYGSVSMVQIRKIIDSFLNNDYPSLKEIFDNLENSSIDYKNFIKKLVDELFLKGIELKFANKQGKYELIKNCVFELNDLINKVNINVNPFLLILMIFLQYMNCKEEKLCENIELKIEKSNVISKKNLVDDNSISPIKVDDEDTKTVDMNQDINENQKISNVNDEFIHEIGQVRLNNCFASADKKALSSAKEKWNKFISKIGATDTIKNLVVDCDVVLASTNNFIFTNPQNSIVRLFNNELSVIEAKYYDIIGDDIKFFSLPVSEWNKEKMNYIKKIKEGYVYKIQEEPKKSDKEEKNVNYSDEESNNNIDLNINDIFDKNKIEIK
jgi:DNA polymerase-3 subunit gamma/tau